ncbi:MAG: PadR family transcriptional regulator [Christensenellales bacterium]
MELNEMILGFLDWKPLTGYELKSIFMELDFLPWSGNNNQIYKALLELERDGMVEKEVIPQEKTPAQKRYSVAEQGKSFLRAAVLKAPDLPVAKNDFLLHLAWSHGLSHDELMTLIGAYQKSLGTELLMCLEKNRRRKVAVKRSEREGYIWDMIAHNRAAYLQNELNWLTRLRNGLETKGV